MKRRQLLRELEQHGCRLLRPGARHDIYWNPLTGKRQPVPRLFSGFDAAEAGCGWW